MANALRRIVDKEAMRKLDTPFIRAHGKGGREEEELSDGVGSSGDYGLSDGSASNGSAGQSGHDEEHLSKGGSQRAGFEDEEVSGEISEGGARDREESSPGEWDGEDEERDGEELHVTGGRTGSRSAAEEGVPSGAVVSTRRGRGDAKEPNQASSFARAFNKVVGSSERGPTGPTDVLSRSKSVIKRQLEEEKEQRTSREAKKLRVEMRKRGHQAVRPKGEEPEIDAREKTLMRIATRGVVRLFNAVAKAQKEAETAVLRGAKPYQAAKAGNSAFLEELKGPSAQAKGAGGGQRPSAQQTGRDDAPGGSKSSWAVLQEGFAGLEGGSKLKDWDKGPDEDDVIPQGEVLEGFSDSDGSVEGAW